MERQGSTLNILVWTAIQFCGMLPMCTPSWSCSLPRSAYLDVTENELTSDNQPFHPIPVQSETIPLLQVTTQQTHKRAGRGGRYLAEKAGMEAHPGFKSRCSVCRNQDIRLDMSKRLSSSRVYGIWVQLYQATWIQSGCFRADGIPSGILWSLWTRGEHIRACNDQGVLAWSNGSYPYGSAGIRQLCQGKPYNTIIFVCGELMV